MPALLLASARGNPTVFGVFVGLHVASAVIGFGALAFSGVYGGTARQLDKAGAAAEARRFFARPNQATWAILAVPFFGVAALLAGDRSSQLGQLWVIAALVIWLGVAGVFTGAARPAERQLGQLLALPDPDPQLVRAAARRLSRAAAVCDVAFVVALGLMIWQP